MLAFRVCAKRGSVYHVPSGPARLSCSELRPPWGTMKLWAGLSIQLTL